MGIFIKLMILLALGACVAPFVIKGPDGHPLMTLDDLKPEQSIVPAGPPEKVTVYRWQDENGTWHFASDVVEGIEAEAVELDGVITTMDAQETRASATSSLASGVSSLPDGLMSVSPDQLGEVVDTATNIQQTMDERKKTLDQMMQDR